MIRIDGLRRHPLRHDARPAETREKLGDVRVLGLEHHDISRPDRVCDVFDHDLRLAPVRAVTDLFPLTLTDMLGQPGDDNPRAVRNQLATLR